MDPHATTPKDDLSSDSRDDGGILRAVQEEVHQTHETARAILRLLLPKEGDRDGSGLEEVLATLVMQQRELLTLVRQVQADVRALHGHDEDDGSAACFGGLNGSRRQ